MSVLNLAQVHNAVATALMGAGASHSSAHATARALVLAQAQGLAGHGLSRVAQYCTHLRLGRAVGHAVPQLVEQRPAAFRVNAHQGLAFEACELAVAQTVERAKQFGVSFAGVFNSHHAGVMVDHLRPVAAASMVGLAFANSPAAMPAAGGKTALFGTNPIAAIFPRAGHEPLMIDLSLSEVARGKLMVAAKAGQAIPLGWALDQQGNPTTDPTAGMHGSMLPIGSSTSSKGAMLALIVELLVTALVGAQFGFEASSFFVDQGNQPRIGQAFVTIDPMALGGAGFYDRIEVLIEHMLQDPQVRLPGARRHALLRQAQESGIEVPDGLLESWL